MRNTVFVVMCTALLGGCLDQVGSNIQSGDQDNIAQSNNTSPTIIGNPQRAILYADAYGFRPEATDADGDKLTFSIENKPDWAFFDPVTGALWGQPDLSSVGVYSDIIVSVSDGIGSDSLAPFSITVSMNALGSVTLRWAPPTENSDGSPLMDLAGYYIYVGQESGVYLKKITVKNSGLTTYVVDNLVPDTYFFAASSFNNLGVEGSLSPEAATTVN